jgi:hypothetical protein
MQPQELTMMMRRQLGLAAVLAGVAASFVACSGNFSSDCEATLTCANAGGAAGASDPGGGSSGSAGTVGESGAAHGGGGSASQGGEAGEGATGGAGGDAGAGAVGGEGGMSEGEGGSAGEAGSGGEGGTPEPPPPECGTTPQLGCVPSATGSVFVNGAAAPDGDGTRQKPFQTIAAALTAVAQGKATRVLICSGIYAERVSLTAEHQDVSLLGGFGCTDWHYDPAAAADVAPTATGYALELQKVAGATVSDLHFAARDATAPAESSIAGFVNESTGVLLSRVTLRSGAGQSGSPGTLTPFANLPTAAVLKGKAGKGSATSESMYVGADGNQVVCPDGNGSTGGKGGSHPVHQLAAPGLPLEIGGKDGVAPESGVCDEVDSANSFTCICVRPATVNGAAGADGEPGTPAAKGGTLNASGFHPFGGGAGGTGLPGGGGSGGDGAFHVGYVGYDTQWLGGGGGGAGGCGGKGATGGAGGGASIALAVRSSAVSVVGSSLITGNAGKGGKGVAGQDGQAGGEGGVAYTDAGIPTSKPCDGGKGGSGGKGGAGGGGAGGVSVGIAFAGVQQPTVDTLTTFQLGLAGTAGPGGVAGAEGVAEQQLQVGLE